MSDIRKAFEVAASLLVHKSHQTLTQAVIELFQDYKNVEAVSAYEIFGDPSREGDVLIRRFPLSLSESIKDENTDLLNAYLSQGLKGVNKYRFLEEDFLILDVTEEIPRRIILVKGEVSAEYMDMIEGVFSIYANQIALLDSKERDALTKLPNRQTFESTFNDILNFYKGKEVDEDSKSSWLAVMDIDKFKIINDNYGHLYGDEVLIHFANLMTKHFRYSDFLFRYGGEEFIVILNNSDKDGARKTLEKFRESVAAFTFPSGQVTVSIGFTHINTQHDISMIIENADQSLYHAKNTGRNRVVHSSEVLRDKVRPSDDVELF